MAPAWANALAALPLCRRCLKKPDRHVLVTTGTVTSAQLMAERLPPRAFHQYVPLDSRRAVKRFLDHWHPDLALFVESELWPNLILEDHTRGHANGARERASFGAFLPRLALAPRAGEAAAVLVR